VLAALMALAAIPALLLLLRRERTPQGQGDTDETAGMGGRHWTRGQAIRHPLFWATVPLVMGPSAWITALFFQQVHLAAEKGWTHLEFVALFPVYTVTSIGAMLAGGWTIDRFGTRLLIPFAQIPLIAGFVLMGVAPGLLAGAAAMALIATTNGVWGPLTAAFWAELYGTRHLGAIRALAAAVMVLGSAIGPVASGMLIDAGLGFDGQMPLLALWFVVTSGGIAVALAIWAPARAQFG
jgi:MFS family permease